MSMTSDALQRNDDVNTLRDHALLTPAQYERWRPHILRSMLLCKHRRRVSLGHDATVVFENRDIVLFHLHERIRAESVVGSENREALLAAHEKLMPAPGELRATLFIDGSDRDRCNLLAQRFCGPLSPVSLTIGGHRIRGDLVDPAPVSVHYLRFAVSDAAGALDDGAPVSLCLSFDAGATQSRLPTEMIHELMKDLGLCSEPLGGLRSTPS